MFVDVFGNEIWSMILEPGVYNITLKKPNEVYEPGFKVVRFPFTVDNLDCETIPNYFNLDKTHIDDGPDEKALYNVREFQIRRCFRLTSPFEDECFHECIGKKGKISIIKNCLGRIIVSNFFPNDDMTREEQEILDSMWKTRLKLNK